MEWGDQLVEKIADRVFEKVQFTIALNSRFPVGKLTFDEPEAAKLLGVERHVLQHARRKGKISPRKIGKSFRYGREMLLKFAENMDSSSSSEDSEPRSSER